MSVANAAAHERPAAVYRLFDGVGNVLYIGSSYAPEARDRAHRQHAPWGKLVDRRTDEWHESRGAAYDAESRAIATEDPVHNVAGTPRHRSPAARGLAQREACDARWIVAVAAIRAGASEADARQAGGWAEVEYLEASGLMPGLAAKWRREMEQDGGTWNSRNMTLPGSVNGRLTWEMQTHEYMAAHAAGLISPGSSLYPPPSRFERRWS